MEHRNVAEPTWWSENHQQGWEKVREAFRRDWEQTKADLTGQRSELHQQAGDTLKQAFGSESIPPRGAASSNDTDLRQGDSGEGATFGFDDVEPAYRFGWGARQQNQARGWDDELDAHLEREWAELDQRDNWSEARFHVKRGWEFDRSI